MLKSLTRKVDRLAIGGAMANTFLAAKGYSVGKSLYEEDGLAIARDIAVAAAAAGCELILPTDVVVAAELAAGAAHRTCAIAEVPDDGVIVDLGPDSVRRIGAQLRTSRAVLWNGPLGAFELTPFDQATVAVARQLADVTTAGVISVAGGGDTLAALNRAGVMADLTFVSTAGGAFLEWVEGRELPGIAALQKACAVGDK